MLDKNFCFLTRLSAFMVFLVTAFLLAGAGGAFASEEDEMAEMELSEQDLKERIREKIKTLVLPNLAAEASVDAVLDEPFWEKAAVLQLEREVYPTRLAPAPVKTEARIIRIQDYLMVGFTAHDPEPERIQTPWRDRDGIDTDDYVSFTFDPAGNNARTFELKVSASGVQGDQIRTRIDNMLIRDWDAVWESAARIVPEGYVVEMRIPLAEFDWPMHRGVKRLIYFKRHYPREVRRTLGAFAVVLVTPEETPGLEKNLLVVPSVTFEYEAERPLTGEDRSWEGKDNPTFSLDVAYRPSPSLSILGTVNPNYLQVEADLAKSSINNAFTTFQPEKRRFFTANMDVFSSLYDLVYTRNIDEPRVGVKVAGTVGNLTTGNFLINDKKLKLIVPGNLGSDTATLDSDSLNAAFRYRYDFRPGLSLGATATARAGAPDSEVSDYLNLVGGLDGYLKLGRYDELRAQWVGSSTDYPEAITDELCEDEGACGDPASDSGLPGESAFNEQVLRADPDRTYRDDAWWLAYKHWQREWFVIGRYMDVGDDFRGDMGFVRRVDYRLANARGGYTWFFDKGEHENARRLRPSVNLVRQEDQSGAMTMESREAWLQYWGASQAMIRVIYRDRDRVAKRFLQNTLAIENNAPEFNEDQVAVKVESPPFLNARFFLEGTFGEEIDKDNYRLGDVIKIEPELRLYWGDRIELTLSDTYKQLDVEGGRLFTENYLRLSLTYQFAKGNFARFTYIDDYIRRDPDLYLFEEVDRMEHESSGELLFALTPGRYNIFYVGLKGGAAETDETNGPIFDNWLFYVKYSRVFRW